MELAVAGYPGRWQSHLKPKAQSPKPALFPLALPSRRIYRAAMRNAVNRVPAETDCPGWCLGKMGGEFLPALMSPSLVEFRESCRLGWNHNWRAI